MSVGHQKVYEDDLCICFTNLEVNQRKDQRTLQQVRQSLGPQSDRPFGFIIGDGEILHAQLLRHFGLRAVVHQRTAEQLSTQRRTLACEFLVNKQRNKKKMERNMERFVQSKCF